MGDILIEKLKVHCIVGLLPVEREVSQDLWLDVSMRSPLLQVAKSESLGEFPDYAECCDLLISHLKTEQYFTLEAAALGSIKVLFQRWDSVQEVSMTLRKPAAHPEAQSCGVRLSLKRSQQEL